MKTTLITLCLLLASCSTADEVWLTNATHPIVVVAVSDKGSVVLRDAQGRYLTLPPGYALSDAIASSYSVGEALK
jgi:hypothetical protein